MKISDSPVLLRNTLQWLCQEKVTFQSTNQAVLATLKRIYEYAIQESSSLPVLAVHAIEDGMITYTLLPASDQSTYVFNESTIKEIEAKGVTLQEIFTLIQTQKGLLIDSTWYPIELKTLREITFQDKLDTDLLDNNVTELQSDNYDRWRSATNDKFSIWLYPGQIPHRLYFEHHCFENKLFAHGNVAIDTQNHIYVNNAHKGRIDALLGELKTTSSFSHEDYISFIKAQQQVNVPPPQRPPKKTEPTSIQTCAKMDDFDESRSEKEFQAFMSKLIDGLNKQQSKWNGYIYHFTHIENALSILGLGKLLPRGQAEDYQDSAGQAAMRRTPSEITNNFARFYFRPLTPTQWNNEFLGMTERLHGYHQMCPVPIFFRFKLEDVLNTHKARCAVSNGDLCYYQEWAYIGNSADFLDAFDFKSIYRNYGQMDYKAGSQQEFIVKDGISFLNGDIDFKIVCCREQDRNTLLNLLGENFQHEKKIEVDPSYYHNKNPYVNIKKSKTQGLSAENVLNIWIERYNETIPGKIRLSVPEGNEYLKRIKSNFFNIKKTNFDGELVIEAKRDMSIEFDSAITFDFKVEFIKDQAPKPWLIYQEIGFHF